MSFTHPGIDAIRARLAQVRSIAVVGQSDSPGRPSYGVALGLQGLGYRIIPVNPRLNHALGLPAYASLDELPAVPDLVDVFRASEHVAGIEDGRAVVQADTHRQRHAALVGLYGDFVF